MFRFSARPNQAHRVRWREWGPGAFEEAREQGKPLALFITAFWCGFCQRMDEAALSDPEVIALLNAFFVPVRVEESQRPDVDIRYNQDGWPTIAFLTPNGAHFHSVNYMDPDPFVGLLVRIVELHQQGELGPKLGPGGPHEMPPLVDRQPLAPPLLYEVVGMMEGLADRVHGGFGDGFKFLHTEAIEFFFYLYEVIGERQYLDHALSTLSELRASPMYDPIAGGFFRYSSKPDWSEPHREKLLYDQAALLRNYLRAFLLTGDAAYRETAEELIRFAHNHLFRGQVGAFGGCQDYVAADGPPIPGHTVPAVPLLDEYVYCDANAAMVSAYLDSWWLLGRDDCRRRAEQVLELLWRKLRAEDGRMYHYWDGDPDADAQVPGLLTDAVETGLALLDAYAILGEKIYLSRAGQLAQVVIRWTQLPGGGFADISQPGPGRLASPVAVMSQNARAALFFLRLAVLAGDMGYRGIARKALSGFPNSHRGHGAFAAGFGQAVGRLLAEPETIMITGEPGSERVRRSAEAALTRAGCGDLTLQFQIGDWPTLK